MLRRVVCDGVDAPRPVEEHSAGARVILPLRGRFAFRDHSGAAVASPCMALYLRDGHRYRIRHVDGQGDVCLALEGDVADALVATGPVARFISQSEYVRAQSLAVRLGRGDAVSRLRIEESLAEILGAADVSVRAAGRRDRAIAEAIAYTLERSFHAPLSLATVARVAGVSIFPASRAFKRARGISIHRYRQEMRLRHALAMVLETDVPLAELAIDLGFANQPHFTNLFRRRFHTTPHAVRRSGFRGQL
jgi:AraC family transcriptional regulator